MKDELRYLIGEIRVECPGGIEQRHIPCLQDTLPTILLNDCGPLCLDTDENLLLPDLRRHRRRTRNCMSSRFDLEQTNRRGRMNRN